VPFQRGQKQVDLRGYVRRVGPVLVGQPVDPVIIKQEIRRALHPCEGLPRVDERLRQRTIAGHLRAGHEGIGIRGLQILAMLEDGRADAERSQVLVERVRGQDALRVHLRLAQLFAILGPGPRIEQRHYHCVHDRVIILPFVDAVLAHFLPGVQARDVRRGRGRELRGELRSPTITHEALQGRIALCVLLDEAPAEPVHDEQDHRAVGRRAVGQRIGGQRDALLPGQQAGDARGNRGEAVPVVGRRDETGIELEHDILVEDWTRGFSRFGGVRMYPD